MTGAAASRQVHTGFVLPPRWRFGADRGQRSIHREKFEQSGGGPTPPLGARGVVVEKMDIHTSGEGYGSHEP